MNITISIDNSVTSCGAEWDELLPPYNHLKTRHLKTFEDAAVNNVKSRYVKVFNRQELIGVVYLQQFFFTHEHLNFSEARSFYSKCLQSFLPQRLPLLVCGHLFRIDFPGFYFKDPQRPTLIFEIIKIYLGQEKAFKPCGIIIKDCETVYTKDDFAHFGYSFFTGDVTMELLRRPHWLSFSDYLGDLNKNYLQRARKVIRAFEGIRQVNLSSTEILEYAHDIECLYRNVLNKQAIKLGIVNVAYFHALKIDLGDRFEFWALFENDTMVAFYTLIFYEQTMETHYIGLDYEANQRAKLYFNILFQSTERMIAGQYKSLELGRTAREAKVNLGAQPKQIFNYTKVNNPLVRMTLNYFLRRFNRAASLAHVDRNPLK